MTDPRRRLADRILDSGRTVAQQYANLDRWDPDRPVLGQIVAEALAMHERIGEERILRRIRDLVQQREQLRDQRLAIAAAALADKLVEQADANTRWANDLDGQIDALRLLLTEPAVVAEPVCVCLPGRPIKGCPRHDAGGNLT